MRLSRAVSGFIEASGIQVVTSGGVKNDRISPSKDADAGATAKEGFGNVPFHRDEYVANRLVAYFNVDLAQLRSYGFDDDATRFLFVLTLWKIRRFLGDGLRLRTACDLDATEVRVTRPEAWSLPERTSLESELHDLVERLGASGAFAKPPITVVSYGGSGTKKAKPKKS